MISIIKVLFGFLGLCLLSGVFFYTIFDLKPWRRDSQLWKSENGPVPVFHRFKKIAQQKFFNRNTRNHIKSYYMYYGLAIMLIAVAFTA
jgi:hypothetical protein